MTHHKQITYDIVYVIMDFTSILIRGLKTGGVNVIIGGHPIELYSKGKFIRNRNIPFLYNPLRKNITP
jgi:hypothetical protein